MNELFPLGVATGKAFLDRDAERSRLHANINTGIHTWLSAPRRYGKTSLVTQVTLELQRGRRRSAQRVRTATVDLLVCHDAGTVETATLHAVGRILGDILPARAKVAAYLRQTFKNVAAELVMAADGPRVRFRITTGQTIALTEALLGLDQVAADHGHRAVVIIDEFQQLSGFKAAGRGIEGAIRHAAQSARCVSYVFMGSERGLLSQQFEQPDRPLYMLCERLILDRIPAEPYRAYLKRASKLQWSKAIDRDVQDRILTRTERHPYYLNTLCRELWRADEAPNATVVDQTWERYVDSERARASGVLTRLSPNQLAVLVAAAKFPTDRPYGRDLAGGTGLAAASFDQSFTVLMGRDLIYKDELDVVRIMDPMLGSYIRSQPHS